ncbi:MAG: CRTAC1 family protein [Gammaproteobacteria bacterium]|nr:MAG: CRTAC1 family protein [Gammaproteobacteria bacterium]
MSKTEYESPAPERQAGPRDGDDDAVIGIALRWSVIVVIFVCLLAVAGWWLLRDGADPVTVEETVLRSPESLPEERPMALPSLPFSDVTVAAGIDFVHENGAEGERLLPETMGGGVAFTDLDGDGLADLLFVNSRPWEWSGRAATGAVSRLYLNRGDGTFRDATAGSGLETPIYGMGVAVGDVDGDGRPELFLTGVGRNRLLRNLGGGRFEDITASAGVAGDADSWSTSAVFLDYDRDGDLDLFVANYVAWSRSLDFEVDYQLTGIGRAYGPPTNFPGSQPYLYRNLGDGRFEDVSVDSGVRVSHPDTGEPMGKALAVAVEDLDRDGWPDLLVANDTVRNFYYRNDGGTFVEQGVGGGLAYDNSGHATGAMGIDIVRHAEAGETAVAIGNFANEMTSYYVDPDGRGLFTDEAIIAGIGPPSRSALSFGLFFFDADLDGRQDLLQANGHVEDEINRVQASQRHAQPAQLFWNCGLDCPRRFVALPVERLGDLPVPMVGRGAAYADMDLDGDLDVVLTQAGGGPRLLRNDQATGHHWLRVRTVGVKPNAAAIGARVRLVGSAGVQERMVGSSRSYLSQTELTLTFGLGGSADVDRLEVIWADGAIQTMTVTGVDREIVLRQTDPG